MASVRHLAAGAVAVGSRKAFLAAARDVDLDQRAAQDTGYRDMYGASKLVAAK
jgi:hypothetical protein